MSDLERVRKAATAVLTDAMGVMGPLLTDEVLQRLRGRESEPLVVLVESFLRLLREELPPDLAHAEIEARIRARLAHR